MKNIRIVLISPGNSMNLLSAWEKYTLMIYQEKRCYVYIAPSLNFGWYA